MVVREVGPEQKSEWNSFVSSNKHGHVLQSWEWGEFKASMGNTPTRIGVFENDRLVGAAQYTIHPIPYTSRQIAYLPKGPVVENTQVLEALIDGLNTSIQKHNCVFLKMEPNFPISESELENILVSKELLKSQKEIFARHTFYLDLSVDLDQLLSGMHEKWRYNIRLAEKKGVVVEERNDEEALETFIRLQRETATRNKFFVHPDQYYRNVWLTLAQSGMVSLLQAEHAGKVLASWMLFKFGKTLYYPYGASESFGREVMPSHALMWAAIGKGKREDLNMFDLWGASAPDAPANDPWIGFTRFKQGFSPTLVSFIGTYDLVVDQKWYKVFNLADKARWWWLKAIRSRF